MNIEIIDSRQQFNTLEENWTALYRQDPSANVFMSWRWLKQLYDRRAEPVIILAARHSTDHPHFVAFLPLRQRLSLNRERRRFVLSYALAGNDWADQTGLLCAPEVEHQAIKAFATALAQMHWQSLSFSDMSMTEDRYAELMAQFSDLEFSVKARHPTDNDGQTRLDVAPCIALPDSYEQYLENLSANTRQRLRRFERHLEKSDDLRIGFSSDATHEENLIAFVRIWRQRWLASKGSRAELLAEKYRKILQQGLEDNNLVLLTLYQSKNPVAMIACYLDEITRTVSFFVAARDVEFDSLPSGLVLHSCMIKWAIDNHYQRYHLLRGDESYKYSLGGIDQPSYSVKVRRADAVEKSRFLPLACRSEALQQLYDYHERLEQQQMHQLYSQLLECWPNDAQTLTQYRNWLNLTGDHDHASCIDASLGGADSAQVLPPALPIDSITDSEHSDILPVVPNQKNSSPVASNDTVTLGLQTTSN